jgi:hypothetical protein
MESRKEGSRPQVRQTALPQYSRTRRRVSPSWGGAFLLRKLTRERRPDKVEKGCSSAPTPSPFPELCGEITAAAGRGGPAPRRVPGQDDPGISGLRDQRGLREDLPVWVCFSSPLRWRPGSPRLACCSGPRRVPRRHRRRLRLPTPPPRAPPSFSGPVTCRPETPSLLKGKHPSER